MPSIWFLVFSFKDDISATNKYNQAKTDNLCLIPLDIEQAFETEPFFLILKVEFVYKRFTHVIKLSPKLFFKESYTKKCHSPNPMLFKIYK